MKKNALTVFYNSQKVTKAQGVCQIGSDYHVAHQRCDQILIELLLAELPVRRPLLVVNCAAQLPPFWKERMASAVDLPDHIGLVSALTSRCYSLSPVTAEQPFNGSVLELDQLISLIQKPSYYPTKQVNVDCFWLRDISFLQNISDNQTKYALNHCLVQQPESPVCLQEVIDIGDQNPLPAHPLATLQLHLKKLEPQSLSYPQYDEKPVVLHITMGWGGGVHKWINDYIQHTPQYHHLVLISCGELYRHQYGEQFRLLWQGTEGVELDNTHMSLPIAATQVIHEEYQMMLREYIGRWSVSAIVISSLIGHTMDCLDTGLPTLRVMHDYFPHWPALSASLDESSIDEQQIKQALLTTKTEPFGEIKRKDWEQWQQVHNQKLKQTHVQIVAPSQSVVDNLKKLNHSDAFDHCHVLPHGIEPIPAIHYADDSNPLVILVLGRISPPKGQQVLDQILDQLSERNDIEFVFLGAGNEGKKYLPDQRIKVIMDYQQRELPVLLEKHRPHLALITSIASETFCYTLSELQSAAIPVLSTKKGALKSRIIEGKTGFFCEPKAEDFVDKILSLKSNMKVLSSVHENLKKLPVLTTISSIKTYDSVWALSKTIRPQHIKLLSSSPWTVELQSLNQLNKQYLASYQQAIQNIEEKTTWAKELNTQVVHLTHNIELFKKSEKSLKKSIQAIKKAMDDNEKRHQIEAKRLNEVIEQKQQQIEEANQQYAITSMELQHTAAVLQGVYESRSWRITKPLRSTTTWLRDKRNVVKFRIKQIQSWPKRGMNSLRTRGVTQTFKIIWQKFHSKQPQTLLTKVAKKPNRSYQPLHINTSAKPVVSIIIPVYNHYDHTHHCLKSLSVLSDGTAFEVIVVDDCSTDDTSGLIKQVTGIEYHRQSQNGGFIESCNTGATLAQGEFLLFLNNDTELHDNSIDSLVQVFKHFPDAGLAGSQLIYPDGRLQEAGGIVFSDASGWNYGRLDDPSKPCYQHVREVSYCSGASILIRRSLFESLGMFDERYKPAYYEDTDLAFAVRNVGLKVYYQPASIVTHFEGVSSGTDLSSGIKKYQVINQKKFHEKWQSVLKKQPNPGTDIEQSRFQNKPKRVLIFDACTPTPDQDSGSLRMLNLMKIFQQLGYQVSFIPENLAHFDQYTLDLQQLGIECIYAPVFSSAVDYLAQNGLHFEVVLLSRYYVAEPIMSMIRSYCPRAQILFDTVDLHYLREIRMAELANEDKQLKAALNTKIKELSVAKACDITLVVSPYEQQVLAKEAPELKVHVLSNIHEIYGCLKPYEQRKDLVFIGGYQHTPNVDGICWFVDAIWPKIKRSLPQVQLHIVGSKAPAKVKALGNHDGVVFHGFVKDIEPVMSDYRIAIAPLRFGAGVKGKVNMSMSYGQPVVGTAVAVEGMYTTHGKDVMMAEDAEQFAECVIQLYQDEGLWNQISEGGLENVRQWFSFDAAKEQIKNILD